MLLQQRPAGWPHQVQHQIVRVRPGIAQHLASLCGRLPGIQREIDAEPCSTVIGRFQRCNALCAKTAYLVEAEAQYGDPSSQSVVAIEACGKPDGRAKLQSHSRNRSADSYARPSHAAGHAGDMQRQLLREVVAQGAKMESVSRDHVRTLS
nr:hypothetical protein [Stutzerimonas stutzeri]